MNKKTFYKLSSAVLLVTLFTHPVFASEEINELKDNSLKIQQSQDELALIKDDHSLSSEEKLALELDARKKIVIQALSLSMEEIESIEENFEDLPEFEEESIENEIKESFIAKLEKFKEYYSQKSTLMETSDELDIEGVKTIAKEIIDYRESVYNPVIKEMVNFNLFFYTKDTIKTANTRIEKILSDLTKLEKATELEMGSFKEDLDKARELIAEAEAINAKAGEKIFAQEETDETEEIDLTNEEQIEGETETNEEKKEPTEDTEEIDPNEKTDEETNNDAENSEESEEASETTNETDEIDTNAIILEGLNKIRSAYEVFLKISIDLRELL